MPTPTYTPLATVTLGSSASSVSFASIPASYRDLILVSFVRSNRAATDDDFFVKFNSDSGSNYSYVRMVGRGDGGASSASNINGTNANDLGQIPAASSTAGQFANSVLQIMDYSATDKHKTTLTRTNAAGSTDVTGAHAGRWANTAAITTVSLNPRVGSFISGSTFNLFGVIS